MKREEDHKNKIEFFVWNEREMCWSEVSVWSSTCILKVSEPTRTRHCFILGPSLLRDWWEWVRVEFLCLFCFLDEWCSSMWDWRGLLFVKEVGSEMKWWSKREESRTVLRSWFFCFTFLFSFFPFFHCLFWEWVCV